MKKGYLSFFLFLSITISLAQSVGIGTTAPEYTLHVKSPSGEASVGVNASAPSLAALLNLSIDNRSDGNSLLFLKYRPGVAGTIAGIPKSNLSFVGADFGAGALFIGTNQNSPIHFATNSLERMRITENGNIGINTGTALARLTINNPIIGTDAFQITHPSGRVTKVDGTGQLYQEGNLWVHSQFGTLRFGYPERGWYWGTINGGQDLQLWSHSTVDLPASRINRMYYDGITGNIGINTGNAPAIYGKLIVDRNNDLNGALTGYFGSITGLSSSVSDGSGVYGISYAPRTGAQSFAGVSGVNNSGGTDRFGVIGTSTGITSGSIYSAGVGGYGDYGVLGYSASATGAGIIAQHSAGKNALEINNGFIKVSGTNKTAFTITTVTGVGGNTAGNLTTLSYTGMAFTDILIVTHNWQANYIGAIGTYWTGTAWAIFREDGPFTTMPNGEKFNIMVIKQ